MDNKGDLTTMKEICTDLKNQYQSFDDLVAPLDQGVWATKTLFYDWTVFDQVAHVAFFDHESVLALEDPDQFLKRSKGIMKVFQSGKSIREHTNTLLGIEDPGKLLEFWRQIRHRLVSCLSKMSLKDRIIWYGPDMSARSFATARLMETWAHSQDVFDLVRQKRVNDRELFHIAHLGVTTFFWSYKIRKLTPPDAGPRVELEGPSGEQWDWGEPDAENRVTGSAEDFCLVVTQRRNVMDTGLECQGENAKQWITIAQAFAGIPQSAPAPGERTVDYKR